MNEEYYHFTAKPEQEAKVERVQQENSIKQFHQRYFYSIIYAHQRTKTI
nr:hypothetical protein [Orientia tsutsugamushi]